MDEGDIEVKLASEQGCLFYDVSGCHLTASQSSRFWYIQVTAAKHQVQETVTQTRRRAAADENLLNVTLNAEMARFYPLEFEE